MRVLDLFSGLGGWSAAFKDRGHEVTTIDYEPKFAPDYCMDILDFEPEDWMNFDVILASPPCQAFSLAAGGTHLRNGREPVSEFGRKSIELVQRTIELCERDLKPRWYWIENPNGGMVNFVPPAIPRVQVTYCQYGESRMKLTNLWGVWPTTWKPRPKCRNGMPCHEAAPRGAKTGTQGIKGAAARAVVPYELSMEVCLACEQEISDAT